MDATPIPVDRPTVLRTSDVIEAEMPAGTNFNRSVMLGLDSNGFHPEHAASFARIVSDILNKTPDPDFDSYCREAGLDPARYSPKCGELGMNLHNAFQYGEIMVIVVGLTNAGCTHQDRIIDAIRQAAAEDIGTYARTMGFPSDVIRGVHVEHQFDFEKRCVKLNGGQSPFPPNSLLYHEGWITAPGRLKFEAIHEKLAPRAETLTGRLPGFLSMVSTAIEIWGELRRQESRYIGIADPMVRSDMCRQIANEVRVARYNGKSGGSTIAVPVPMTEAAA